MTILKHKISPTVMQAARHYLKSHLDEMAVPGRQWREFGTDEVSVATTYAAVYLINAVQGSLFDALVVNPADRVVGVDVGDGWRARNIDLGLHWKRHTEFFKFGSPGDGFVVQGELAMVRKPASGPRVRRSAAEIAKNIFAELNDQDAIKKDNLVTADFDPADCTRLDGVSVHPFHGSGQYNSRDAVLENLRKGAYSEEIISVNPERKMAFDENALSGLPPELRDDYTNWQIGTTSRHLYPQQTLEFLPVFHRFLKQANPERVRDELATHARQTYYTLERNVWFLLAATRAAIETASDVYPPKQFRSLVEKLWSDAVCRDVTAFLPQIREAAEALVEMGHTTACLEFECNDGRTRVYADEVDGVTRMFVKRHENKSVVFTVGADRVSVNYVDYGTGKPGKKLVDLVIEDGVVKNPGRATTPFNETVASVLRVAMVDCSSTHCYVVSDRETTTPATPAP